MRKIHRKVLRDIARSKGPFVATVVIVFLGVTLFGATYASYQNLSGSYDYSYERLNFADALVQVQGAPANVSVAVGGVREVYGRLQVEVPVEVMGRDVRVLGRIISVPRDSRPPIDDVKVTEGEYPSSEGQLALVESNFAAYHGLHPGDSIRVSFPNETMEVTLSGVAISPEYVWPARSKQEVWPVHEDFGVFFLPYDLLDGRVYPNGTVNQVGVLVDEGLSGEDRAATIASAVDALAPYHVLEVTKKEDQASYALLKVDIQGFSELAVLFPMLFLTVAAIVLYMSLARTVAVQRPQIGVLRAIGYGSRAVALHYLEYAILGVVIGSLAGALGGHLLSGVMTGLYVGELGLPYLVVEPAWEAIPAGVIMSLLFGVIGAAVPALAAARVRPAEAMRSEGVSAGRGRLGVRRRGGSALMKLPWRNVARNKKRSLFTAISLALAVALILTSAGFVDSVDEIMTQQYERIQAYDAKVELAGLGPEALEGAVDDVEGVAPAEAILEFPVNISFGEKAHTTLGAGLRPEGGLYRLFDPSGKRLRVDARGVVLVEAMADSLGARKGDSVVLETPTNRTEMVVLGVADQPFGPEVFLPLDVAQDFLGVPGLITAVLVGIDEGAMTAAEKDLEAIPGVAAVQLKAHVRASFEEFMDLFTLFTLIMVSFGVAMAVAIVMNTATLNANERRREHASMRAMGVRVGEIARVMTVEIVILGVLSLGFGALLGTALAIEFADSFSSEFFSFEISIHPRSYVVTTVGVLIMALISQLPALRAVARMDLAEEVRARAA